MLQCFPLHIAHTHRWPTGTCAWILVRIEYVSYIYFDSLAVVVLVVLQLAWQELHFALHLNCSSNNVHMVNILYILHILYIPYTTSMSLYLFVCVCVFTCFKRHFFSLLNFCALWASPRTDPPHIAPRHPVPSRPPPTSHFQFHFPAARALAVRGVRWARRLLRSAPASGLACSSGGEDGGSGGTGVTGGSPLLRMPSLVRRSFSYRDGLQNDNSSA